ncbi:acyl-CoA thioesterase [Marinobacter orientalis]|uniref:Acyl-CoA thioesterase n=1 Tax=Marinobacter orientalis TaxID=1928859 RepID=A0A7Y0NJ14_9GAMM|nr:thioesterase family protein [Marinobacter orientalis]NMT62366.1 acyl-CoA thioesterase [Marinobacter orientalis]TGX51071.1 acyl-CoA thioesterase [Marinobacter orientalis]
MQRDEFSILYPITTRWMDNDIYGHVNNVTYYSYFDTTINRYLIEAGGLDINNSPVVGYVVSSSCQFKKPVAYPEALEAGLRVLKMGNSSVTYELGLFKSGDADPVAHGEVVHVFVDREQNRAVAIPHGIREALERILM